jgi:streptogramin lyase
LSSTHARRACAAAAALLTLVVAAPAQAATDAGGATIPNTSTVSETAQLDGSPSLLKLLATPSSPADDAPAALAALGAPEGPEEDLAAALDRIVAATTQSAAASARRFALDILEGAPLARAYSGIPLLNWNAPAKIKTVPAGGTVTVRQVRFGQHVVSDTWLLQFADPDQPFKIAYEVAELERSNGGELAPTPLLTDGGVARGGLHSVVAPLGLPELQTGTLAVSRFHPAGAAEHTRLAVERVVVKLPPPRFVSAILDPSRKAGHEALATLTRATPERIAAATAAFGFSGSSPTTAQRRAAIAKLAPGAPERRIWTALDSLDPAAGGFLAAAKAAAADVRPLVGEMRVRAALPNGAQPQAGADVTVELVNNETYVSRRALDLPPGAALRVAVVNRDGFARQIEARELRDRRPVFGPANWGEFDWGPLGAAVELAAGETKLLTLTPATTAFAVWIGDRNSGDQAATAIELDRGPRRQAIELADSFAAPRNVAEDGQGRLWVTLQGVDKIARVTPASDLAAATVELYPLPSGSSRPGAPQSRLAPADVFVDGRGIVWVTLELGNAIARIDPALTRPGSSDGIVRHALPSCPSNAACRDEFPAEPANPGRSRGPLAIDGLLDADGNTVLFAIEANADRIAVLRFAPNGTQIGSTVEISCGCTAPGGIALAPDGAVWFSQRDSNALGRLRLGQARPYSASAAQVDHFPIPFATTVDAPSRPQPISTALPGDVEIDPVGRVWFAAEAVGRVGYLDPLAAVPGDNVGYTSFATGSTAFGAATAPAGLAVDRAGTVFWADRVGDAVGSIDASGASSQLQPLQRRSLTGAPLAAAGGDLWFTERGASALTRVEGVGEGAPRPRPQPLVEARTTDDTLHGSGFAEASTVDVEVVRDATVAARAEGVSVAGGSFAVALSDWSGPAASDPLRAGDEIRVTPRGAFTGATLSFTAAQLTGAVEPDGDLSGGATAGGTALAGSLDGEVAGAAFEAAIDPDSGAFTHAPPAALPADASGSLSWTGATAAVLFRTVTRFPDVRTTPVPDPEPGPEPDPDGDDDGEAVPPPPVTPPTASCSGRWLSGRGRTARVELIGLRGREATACLGRPSASAVRHGVRRWRYSGRAVLSLVSGRVVGLELLRRGLPTARGRVGRGSRFAKLARQLRGAGLRGSATRKAALLPTAAGGRAKLTVRLSVGRPRRIAALSVTAVPVRGDRGGEVAR